MSDIVLSLREKYEKGGHQYTSIYSKVINSKMYKGLKRTYNTKL